MSLNLKIHFKIHFKTNLTILKDGICGKGEQLFLTPFGDAVCGCRRDPVHDSRPGDGKCFPLFTQGPCPQNFTLQVAKRLLLFL
jgi:hypothetical protein